MRRALILAVALVLAGLAGSEPAAACPGCKEAAAAVDHTDGNAGAGSISRVSQGFTYTIYGMMSLPFLLTGGGGLWLYLAHRRTSRNAQVQVQVQAARSGSAGRAVGENEGGSEAEAPLEHPIGAPTP